MQYLNIDYTKSYLKKAGIGYRKIDFVEGDLTTLNVTVTKMYVGYFGRSLQPKQGKVTIKIDSDGQILLIDHLDDKFHLLKLT
jgi:hypothetical protein